MRTRTQGLVGGICALISAFALGSARAASDDSTLIRAALDIGCAAITLGDVIDQAAALPVDSAAGERPIFTRHGWRKRFVVDGSAADGQTSRARELTLERLAPYGVLHRVTAQIGGPAGARPELVAVADHQCRVTLARRLVYDAAGQAVRLEELDEQLIPAGWSLAVNPPVPPAEDPVGVPVAVVDTGVNYLLPEIAPRLARDARSGLTGYDYWDGDRRPFDLDLVGSAFFPAHHGTRIASIVLNEAPVAKLIVYRYPRPDMARMTELIDDAAAHGVRIVNVSLVADRRDDWRAFEAAAARHPEMLFVVAAGNDGRDLDREPAWPASLPLDNILTVTFATEDGRLPRGANWGAVAVDVMVPGDQVPALDFDGRRRYVAGSSYATARVSALAACLLAAAPHLSTTALRRNILDLATVSPDSTRVAGGFIPLERMQARGACGLAVAMNGI